MSGLGGSNIPIRFGEPTITVWHPIVSNLQVRCSGCKCKCHVHLDGTLLHSPKMRPHAKHKGKFEAPPHSGYCPASRRRR